MNLFDIDALGGNPVATPQENNINHNTDASVEPANDIILLLDWSNLMFRSLFLHKLYEVTAGYEREEDMKSFTHKFAVDICSIINLIKPMHTIICCDSQDAWRKDILPGEDGYKGNREKDKNINWENIYKCSDDLLKILEKQPGISVCMTSRAEADDLTAMIKEVVFEKYPQYSLIVVSSDADLQQLLDFNLNNKQFCIVYNTVAKVTTKKKHMYVPKSFKDWLDAPEVCDIFFTNYNMDIMKKYFKDLLAQNANIEMVVKDSDEVLLNKILCGDDGDNVPAFYSFYKNGKLVRVTQKRSEKMMNIIGARNLKELTANIGQFADVMKTVFKIDEVNCDCKKRLERQKLLVELDSRLFPENIRDYKSTIDYIVGNIRNSGFRYIKADDILKGTPYEGWGKRRALEADIFKEFNKLTTYNKKVVKEDKNPEVVDKSANIGFDMNTLF